MPTVKAAGITAKINVNTVEARSSVNMLKRSIRELTRDWKNDYRALVAAGRSEDALRRKHRGLLEVQKQLKDSIDEVKEAIDRSSESSGTRKYKQTVVDLKRMVIQLKGVDHQLQHNTDVLVLHNDAIRRSSEVMNHDKQVGQELVEQYRNEGNEIEATNQKIASRKRQIRDLTLAEAQYKGTINRAKKLGTDKREKTDFDKDVEKLAQIRAEKAKLVKEDNLSNVTLMKLERNQRIHLQFGDRLLANYKAEGHVIRANNQKIANYRVQLRDLDKVKKELTATIQYEKQAGYGNTQQVKAWKQELADAKTKTLEINKALVLNEDELKQAMSASKNYRVINQELVKQYKAQGQAMTANDKSIEGYKERLRDLKIIQKELTSSMAGAEREGQTETDTYKKWTRQLAESRTEVARLTKALALNQAQLQQDMKMATDNRIIGQQLVNQYKAQSQSLNATSQQLANYRTRLSDLSRVQNDLAHNMAKAERNNLAQTDEYRTWARQMAKAKATTLELKRAQQELDSGLTTGKQYNDLYNQSTEKVVSSLKDSKHNAEAARIEYIRLARNMSNETAVIERQRTVALRAANANRTQADITGKSSVAYQRESSKLEGLIATERRHKYQMDKIKRDYGLLSAKGATAVDNLSKRIRGLDRSAHNDLRTAHALTNGGIALGAAFYYGAKQSIGLQHEFNKTGVLARNSGERIGTVTHNVRAMSSEAVAMSEKFGVSQQKISDGFEQLIRRGYSSGQAIKAMPSYLKAATASGEDLGDVINSAGSSLEGFGLKNKNIGHNTKVVTNEMAAGADYTASSFKDMAYSMSYVGPIAHQTNQSVSETSAALGELANNGIKGSMAGTSLRKVLQNVAGFQSNKASKKILSNLGLSPKDFQNSKGNLLNISTIMGKLHDKMKSLNGSQQTNIMQHLFGRTGSQAAQVLTNNANAVGELNGQIQKATKNGYTTKTSRQNMKTTEGQLLRLKMSATELAREYADNLRPAFSKMADVAIGLSKGLSKLPSSVRTIVSVSTLAVPAIAALSYVMATVKKTSSIWYQVQRYGVRSLFSGKSAIEENSDMLNGHISVLDHDTSARKQNNQEIERAISLTNQLSGNVKKDSAFTQSNSTTTDVNSESKRNNNEVTNQSSTSHNNDTIQTTNNTRAKQENTISNESNGKSEESNTNVTNANAVSQKEDAVATESGTSAKNISGGSDIANTVSGANKAAGKGGKLVSRGALGAGAVSGVLMGGSEAAAGDPKGGLKDGIGTAGGMVVGTGIAGPVGGAIGSVVGPMLVRAVSNSYGKEKKKINHPGNYKMKNPMTGATDDSIAQDAAKYAKTYAATFNSMNRNNRRYVWNLQRDQRNAEESYINHRGKMTNVQRGYYNSMYNSAATYEKHRMSSQRDHLQELYKDGYLTKSEYNSEDAILRQSQTNKLTKLKKYEKDVINASGKSRGKRKEALKNFDNELLMMTHTSASKRKRVLKHLLGTASKISASTYRQIKKNANRTYTSAVNSAKDTYSQQKALNKQHYNSAVDYAAKIYGVHSTAYANAVSQAKDHETQMNDKAHEQEKKTETHAKDQKDGVINAAREQRKETVDNANKQSSGIQGVFSSLWSGFKSLFSGAGKKQKITKDTMFATGTPDTQALHLANGYMGNMNGRLTGLPQTSMVVVNDGDGRELIRLPNGQLTLPSGRNVHTILPKGSSVFNANQTRSLLGRQAVHLATGNVGEIPTVSVKGSTGRLKKTEKSTKKSMANIHDILNKGYKKTGKDVMKRLSDLYDSTDDNWSDTYKLTKDHVSKIHDDTTDRYSDLENSINDIQSESNTKTNSQLETTTRYFKRHFDMIPPITRNSMKSGISNINSGISAIDRALAQFGGNSRVLGMVHYAGGTSGPNMNHHLAMLNDATGGPTQEAIVSDTGRVRMPRGRNVVTTLNPGDKVMNGTDTLRAIKSGLIPHYAGGLKSTDALRNLAKHYAKVPTSFTNDTFNKLAQAVGSVLAKNMTGTSKQGAQHPANAWSNIMWKYIDTLINPDNSVLLQKVHALGDGRKYAWGGNGPSSYDCSGLVHAALSALNISSPRLAGEFKNIGKVIPRSEASPGDIVESAKHVGVVDSKGANSYFSAYNTHVHPNILSQPLDNAHFTPGSPYWFVRIPQLSKYNREEQEVQSNPLTGLVKHQLGNKASNWVYKNLGNYGGAEMTNGHGALAQIWNAFARHSMNAKQIAGAMGSIWQEDSSFRADQLGYDGSGLGFFQITPGSLLKSWAARHGRRWTDPAAQADCYYSGWLRPKGFFSVNGSLYDEAMAGARIEAGNISDSLPSNSYPAHRVAGAHKAYDMFAKHHGRAKYAHGGLSVGSKLAHISEGDKPEMILPLTNKSRSVELMLKSLQYMFGENQNSSKHDNQQNSNQESIDRHFEQELIKSNRHKDELINNILNKMTILIKTVRDKPVISDVDIYNANRSQSLKNLRLRNLNRGSF